MTHKKKTKEEDIRTVCNMFPPVVSHSMICFLNCLRTRLSRSDLKFAESKNSVVFFFYSNDTHHNAEIETYQQPRCKLNHLFWTFVIKGQVLWSLIEKCWFQVNSWPSLLNLHWKPNKIAQESQFVRNQKFSQKFCFWKTNPEICVFFAAFFRGPDGRLQQRAVQQLLWRPPTRAPPVGRQSVIHAHGHREQPRWATQGLTMHFFLFACVFLNTSQISHFVLAHCRHLHEG